MTKRDVQGSVGGGEMVRVITGPYESKCLLSAEFIKKKSLSFKIYVSI